MVLAVIVLGSLGPVRAWARIGEFESSVDEETGAAIYVIPIVTPPGAGGTAPELALRYASGDGRGAAGWAGLGWRLSGESRIRRSTRRGVPYDYEAGRVCGGGFCYADVFELDGAELVCADLSCDGLYKTRVDDGRRIRYLGESVGWEIRERDGRLRVYGASASHRIVNPANGQVHSWLLERVEDLDANWIAYTYDVTTGAAYLRIIEWAQAGASANRSVEFLREPRPDAVPDYRAGFREQVAERVVRIEVRADPGGLVTAYQLDYVQGPTSGRSLLASVRRLGADDATGVPPHRFEYSFREIDPNDGALRGLQDAYTSFEEAFQLDFMGLAGASGTEGLVDLNADAIPDYYRASAGLEDRVWAYLSNGEHFEPGTPWLDSYLRFWWSEGGSGHSGLTESTFDLDGDGRADHVEPGAVRLGSATGFGPEIPWTFDPDEVPGGPPLVAIPGGPRLSWSSGDDVFIALLDLTGDGRPDRVHCKYASQSWSGGEPGWLVYPNLGLDVGGASGGFAAEAIDWDDPMGLPCARGSYLAQALQQTPVTLATLDVNGDGLPDHLRSGVMGMYVAYNNGSGFDPEERALDVAYRTDLRESAGTGHWYTQPLDINGDGFLDYVGSWRSWAVQSALGGPPGSHPFWAVFFGNGSGFDATPTLFGQCEDPYYADPSSTACDGWEWEFTSAYSPANQHVMDFADFDGDGLLDRFYRQAGAIVLNAGPVPDLLHAATTPLGARILFEYGSSGGQRLDGLPANPDMPMSRPLVTRRTLAADPNSVATADEWHYAGGVYDPELGMFLGFASVERRELTAEGEVKVETRRAIDRACAGRIEHVVVTSDAGVLQEEAREYLRINGSADPSRSWHACLLEARTQWAREGLPLAQSRARRTRWDYGPSPVDSAYNPRRIDELGEVDPLTLADLPGDGRSTHLVYAAANSQLNLVSKLSERWVEDPEQPGVAYAHTRVYYDGLPHGVAPTRGLPSALERWFANPEDVTHVDRWVTVAEWTWDVFGNLAGETDAEHETSTGIARRQRVTVWDPAFASFPIARIALADEPNAPAQLQTLDYTDCGTLAPPAALGLACTQRRADGVVASFGFDALGRTSRVVHPGGLVETREYAFEATGASTTTLWTPESGPALSMSEVHDGLGRLVVADRPGRSGETVRVELAYDARGRLASESAPRIVETAEPVRARRYEYDGLGRTSLLVDADGETLHTWIREPWSVTEDVWFGPDRQQASTRVTDGQGRLARLTRYADPVALAEPLSVGASYDVLDQLVRVDDAIASGAACAEPVFCPAQSHATVYEYDSLGRRVRIDDPDSGTERRRYDPAGLLQERIDARGVVESTDYDALGRVMARTYGGSEMLDARFVYEDEPGAAGFGQLRRVVQDAAEVSYDYAYDAFGRVASVEQQTAGLRFLDAYSWDAFGRLARRTFPDGESYRHAYDGTRLVGIHREGTGGFDILLAADYDAAGRPTHLEIGRTDLLHPASAAVRLERDYDPSTGRLAAMRALGRDHEGLPALDLALEFDGLGRLVSSDGRSFRYDGLGRLTSATGPWEQPQANAAPVTWTYDYDALGNLRRQTSNGVYERSWDYQDPARPRFVTRFRDSVAGIPRETQVIVPDAAGNPARINDESLVWNAMNRLAYRGDPWSYGVRYYDASGAPVLRWFLGTELIRVGNDFEYDTGLEQGTKYFYVAGERVASRARAFTPQSASIPAWLYGWTGPMPLLVALALSGLGLACVLVTGTGLRAPGWVAPTGIAMLAGSLVLYPLHAARGVIGNAGGPEWHGGHGRGLLVYANDALGSPRAVLDAAGNTVETRDYAPFGMTIAHTGAYDLKHRFTGQPHDDRIRLQDYGARMYDPRWGRFLTPDEVTQPGDPLRSNRYAYAYNRPTSLVDPDGRIAVPTVAAASLLVSGVAATVAMVSEDPEVDRVAMAVAAGSLYVGVTVGMFALGAPPTDPAIFMGIVAGNLGVARMLTGVFSPSRSIEIRSDGVDASAFSGERGGIVRVEVREGSVRDIRLGRIVFRDGSAIEIEDGQPVADESGSEDVSPSVHPESPSPGPPNAGREGRMGSHSLRSGGAHAGGNLAQTGALLGWIADGAVTVDP